VHIISKERADLTSPRTMTSVDAQHLKALSIAHYVVGSLGMLFSFIPIFHVIIGWMMVFSPESLDRNVKAGNLPPPFEVMGWMFMVLGATFILIGLACSVCILLSGRFLAARRKYWFSFVVACVECVFLPFGTILGVFTIVVLSRESVKSLYGLQDS
jgi:hypothetical protein